MGDPSRHWVLWGKYLFFFSQGEVGSYSVFHSSEVMIKSRHFTFAHLSYLNFFHDLKRLCVRKKASAEEICKHFFTAMPILRQFDASFLFFFTHSSPM